MKALLCQWTKIKKLEFYQCVTKCCSDCNTLQNFGLHPISEPPLRVLLYFYMHLRSLCELVWVLTTTLLDRSTDNFFMLILMSCLWPCPGHTQGLCFMCTCCVHYVNIHHAHTRSHIHCQANIVIVLQWPIMRIALLAHMSINHVEHVCLEDLSVLVIKSCKCVFANFHMHLFTHSHT